MIMMDPVIARGSERSVLGAVLSARSRGGAVVVPPTAHAELPDLDVPEGHMVAFTSGSTGTQRGILRTHASWTASLDPLSELMGLQASDRICVLGSVRSTMGLYGAVHAMHALGEVLLSDEPRERATIAHAVPAAARELLAHPPESLRMIVVAGDRVPEGLCELSAQRGVALLEYYGATELSFVAYRQVTDGTGVRGLVPFPGVQVRIDDGVVWARSAYLALGYLGSTDGPGRWVDGWATVGDQGTWDQDRLVIEGRGAQAITVGGHTVHLADVEGYFRDRLEGTGAAGGSGVEVAILAQEHEVLGEVPVGIVTGGDDEVQRARVVARDLPDPARPRRWIAVGQMPRTPAGKVDRLALTRLVQDSRVRRGPVR